MSLYYAKSIPTSVKEEVNKLAQKLLADAAAADQEIRAIPKSGMRAAGEENGATEENALKMPQTALKISARKLLMTVPRHR